MPGAYDPTRAEMLAVIESWPFYQETDEFDRERAMYWFAANYHAGQGSCLYEALSQSPYKPSPMESQCDTEGDGMAGIIYNDVLVPIFSGSGNRA